MKTAILGATGYTGMLLTRLLASHPGVDQILPVSSSKAGDPLRSRDPGFADEQKLIRPEYLSISEMGAQKPDIIFACLPHLTSAEVCAPFIGESVVVDLSADFRISDAKLFESAYGVQPPTAAVPAAYGLSELNRKRIASADLIANPGCYPTATLLPLLPLLSAGAAEGPVIVNAISGISGAGRKSTENLLFCERSENAGAYAPGQSHRHWSEMTDQLRLAGSGADLYFTPHLAPLRRGMAVTTTVEGRKGITQTEVESILEETYSDSPFVRILHEALPQTREVCGSNRCDIAIRLEGRRIFLFSCIDNLMKGASGQALQNMNIRFGFDERAGLPLSGLV